MPIKKFSIAKVKTAIKKLEDKKASGYNLVTPRLLKEMPHEEVKFLTQLLNKIVLLHIVRPQWQVAQINMILKPGKKPTDPKS